MLTEYNCSKKISTFKYKIAEKKYLSDISEIFVDKCCIVEKQFHPKGCDNLD